MGRLRRAGDITLFQLGPVAQVYPQDYRVTQTEKHLMDITKLISALQAASDGSEYLDYAIQRQFSLMKPVPAYTRSLDAAMQLIPEGWSIHRMGQRHDCRGNFTGWFAELYRASDAVIEFPANSPGATAPLAVCLAAMRIQHASQLLAQASEESGAGNSNLTRHSA